MNGLSISELSRYAAVGTVEITLPDGRTVNYFKRRFVPQPDALDSVAEHVVAEGDRLDRLAAQYLSDPTLFWRICDGNLSERPDDLTAEAGRRLRITLPEGIVGPGDA